MINISDLKKSLYEIIIFLDKYIDELSSINNIDKIEYTLRNIETEIVDYINTNEKIRELRNSCSYIQNSFSPISNKESIERARIRTINNLKEIKEHIENNKVNMIDYKSDIDEYNSLLILKKILNNFPLHIKAMYLDKCHGKGNIQKKQLDSIKIGNEYDVQRMVYSIIKPIFPNATTEVIDNVGCSTVRYDIDIDSCNTTIEVKCSRESMTERSLNEEMGSDSFHYNRKNIIFFVYDKESIISNIDDYKKTYNKMLDDKNIDIIIIQPRIL